MYERNTPQKKDYNPFDLIEKRFDAITHAIHELTDALNNSPSKVDRPLSLTEALHYLDIAKPTLYLLTSRREIPHLKRGQKLYFLKEDLDNWLLSHRIKATTAKGNNKTESVQSDGSISNQGEV